MNWFSDFKAKVREWFNTDDQRVSDTATEAEFSDFLMDAKNPFEAKTKALGQELADVKATNADLTQKLADTNATLASLNETVASLKADLAAAQATDTDLDAKLSKLTEAVKAELAPLKAFGNASEERGEFVENKREKNNTVSSSMTDLFGITLTAL